MSERDEERLPGDLEPIAAWLRAERFEADPLRLDQLKQRARARSPQRQRRPMFMKARIATILTIVGLAGGTGGALAIAAGGGSSGSHMGAADSQYRPGKGCGDRNHVHTGPPGNPSNTSCPPQSHH